MKDCYFFIDTSDETVSDDDKTVTCVCVECKDKLFPEANMWLWEGSKFGYGPWKYQCDFCNEIIYVPNEENK